MTDTRRPAPLPDRPGRPDHPGLAHLARAVRRLPPSCGPVRLVAVDGHAGSGKSTFTARLAEALDGAPVLRLDDIASHADLFDWTDRLLRQVVEPLSRGETAHYAAYDWHARRFGPADRPLPAAPVVLMEGVGAGRRVLRPFLAGLLWMDLPRDTSWARGRRRDGPALSGFWDGWEAAERRHFAEDPSRRFAQLLVRELPVGYELLAGSDETAALTQIVTQGEGPSAAR
ncbi:uridine kinase [Streptomyces sp. RK9]|uniref:uridine kinase family protein n=1 Tax=Streptomyces sp. RK9 TaxID=3239284 RepID=UPI00386D30B3